MSYCNVCGVKTGEQHDEECTYGGTPVRFWIDDAGKFQYEPIKEEDEEDVV